MALTPAQRAQQRARARLAAASATHGEPVSGDAHTLLLSQLVEHRRALKDIQSIERKIEAKRGFLHVYDDWVDQTLAHGNGGQDPLITTVLVWHIDAGNYARAVEIAAYAMRHSLELPDQYERSLAVALIDEFAQASLTGKMSREESLSVIPAVIQMTCEDDAPDQARAKLMKAQAYALMGKSSGANVDLDKLPPETCVSALAHCQRALELFDGVGTKKDIERLERHIKKTTTAAAKQTAAA